MQVVISNHNDLRRVVESFGIPFKVFPITAENKPKQEGKELTLLKDELEVDVVVLARYMQVLSNEFLDSFKCDEIINIHHSFLPAFMGGRPYHAAYGRGVKLIGATVRICYLFSNSIAEYFNVSIIPLHPGSLCNRRIG